MPEDQAELDRIKREILGARSNSIIAPTNDITAPSTPESTAAAATSDLDAIKQQILGRKSLGVPAPSDKPTPPNFSERNARPGIYMDPDLELTAGLKTKLLMLEKPEDKVALLEGLVGKGNVRLADNGEPIVTTYDQKRGMPVEFRAMGSGANVIPHAQALIPETAGALALSELAAAKLPATMNKFLRFGAEMIAAGTGQELGGAAKDIAVSSTPLDAIIEERAKRIPQDVAANAVLGGAAKLALPIAGKIISPFGGTQAEIEQGAAEARQFFLDKFGIDYRMTPAERTSSPLFKRSEAYMSRNPGASAAFDVMQRQKIEDFRKIQAAMLGSKITPADIGMLQKLEADVGEEAISAIRQNINPVVRAEETARNAAAGELSDAIMNELAQTTTPARQLYPERVGAQIRRGAVAREDAFKQQADALYNEAYSKPGGIDKAIEPPNLQADAKALLEKQPAPEVTTSVPTGVTGPTGQPIMRDVTGQQIMREFVPEGVLPMLNSLANLDRAKFSLQDLVKMRTEVRNSIKRGAAIGNVKDHYLGEIEDMLTKAINEGTERIPGGELKQAWEKANQFYAEGAPAFKEKNIARLFKDKETGAFVQDEDLVRNIGPSEYQSYKNFFGENSPEFQSLKRGIVDQLVPQGTGELIDAKQFMGNLKAFIQKNRSVAEDVLGVAAGATSKEHPAGVFGDLLQKVQAGDKLSIADLNEVAAQGKLTTTGAVMDLINKQRALTDAYRSSIVKDIASGKLGETFNAGEFVDRLWSQASTKEIQAIKGQLAGHPEVLEDLERKAAARIFDEAQSKAPLDPVRLSASEPFRPPNTSSIERVFGSDENKARMAALLGPERMKEFEQLANLLRGGEAKEALFSGAASLSGANNIQKMLRGDLLSYLPMWFQQRIVATLYFSQPIQKLLTNQVGRDPQAIANMARAVVTSQPFLSAITDDYGSKVGNQMIDKILDSIDLTERQGPPGAARVGRQSWLDQVVGRAKQGEQRVFPVQNVTNAPAPAKGK